MNLIDNLKSLIGTLTLEKQIIILIFGVAWLYQSASMNEPDSEEKRLKRLQQYGNKEMQRKVLLSQIEDLTKIIQEEEKEGGPRPIMRMQLKRYTSLLDKLDSME